MTTTAISTITRTSFYRPKYDAMKNLDNNLQEADWKEASFIGKTWMLIRGLAIFASDALDTDQVHVTGFKLLKEDGTEEIFPYGNNETDVMQQVVNAALSQGYSVDHKSLSMFAHNKLDTLILTK